jgi:hypothetical protein
MKTIFLMLFIIPVHFSFLISNEHHSVKSLAAATTTLAAPSSSFDNIIREEKKEEIKIEGRRTLYRLLVLYSNKNGNLQVAFDRTVKD